MPARRTTQLSTRGQVVLPKAVREEQGLRAGDTLVVESTANGVNLRRVEKKPSTRYEDVRGSLGPPKRAFTIEEMSAAFPEAVRRRWKRKSLADD